MKNKIIPAIIIAICVVGIVLVPRPQVLNLSETEINNLVQFPWNDKETLKDRGFIEQEDGSFLLRYGEEKEHTLSVYFGQNNTDTFNITITQQGIGLFSLPLWFPGNSPVVRTGAGAYKEVTFVFNEEIGVYEKDNLELCEALK